jgi:hypothetical protein
MGSAAGRRAAKAGLGPEKGVSVGGVRRRATITATAVAFLAVAMLALVLSPSRARAFESWAHDGAVSCRACHMSGGSVTDASCTRCHDGFLSVPAKTCWSCHYPGQDTAPFASPSSACSQGCHLYRRIDKDYTLPYTHGTEPHLGAAGYGKVCLDCHQTSISIYDPGESPHHSGVLMAPPTCEDCHNGVYAGAQETHDGNACTSCHDGMDIPSVPAACNTCHASSTFGTGDCLSCHPTQVHNTDPNVGSCSSCHSGYQKHAGELSCTQCHTSPARIHHGTLTGAVAKSCRSCHPKRHAGRNVPGSKCATCHKGGGSGPAAKAQHSNSITKKFVCSACHSQRLHASAVSGAVTSCRTCHSGKYHAAQQPPSKSVCMRCHTVALRHDNGYPCTLCHSRAIHNPRPSAAN